ncbi:alkylresorcinol/alkylpyrone synthase [Stella humosa]|uniref:Alkylresorcinol/alkylpyrone synthase n=1 Tax=Stella humosa TaxID=94 RepID=A0A3N1LJI9_9PROT|nr:type III polyketide synthase [Stella humosa]ROP90586.1 alkylresorcinol/alkylpyrone synthase [Stella humosa]BBK29519.1 chalcone synthase [Stella humosa]
MRLEDEPASEPRLVALATAVPRHFLAQEAVAEAASAIFAEAGGGFQHLAPVYRHAEIRQRRSCVPLEWFARPHGLAERNRLFLDHAVALLAEAATAALDQAGLAASDIDMLVTVSSTGIATPALDARLMARLPFRADVQRLPVFGLGCAGGVLGLARAAALARAAPGSRVLLLAVELCSLTFRRDDRRPTNIVATALFGDGAAAAIVTCRDDDPPGVPLGPWGEHTWPGSIDVMGWELDDEGFQVVFSREIPALVRQCLRPAVDAFLARHAVPWAGLDGFLCHPGGAKVLDALADCLELRPADLRHARAVLRDHGNMSSVTVLFVLRAAMDEARTGRGPGIGGRCLMTALGPGFTAGMLMLDLGR